MFSLFAFLPFYRSAFDQPVITQCGARLGGVTDHITLSPSSNSVTRTLHFGTPTAFEKRAYTRVLQGHIAIDEAVFPSTTTGFMLDPWARKALWKDGLGTSTSPREGESFRFTDVSVHRKQTTGTVQATGSAAI